MKSTETYAELVAVPTIGLASLERIAHLVDLFGDDDVAVAMKTAAVALSVSDPPKSLGLLLSKTGDLLAQARIRADAGKRPRPDGSPTPGPSEIPGRHLLAVARGEHPEPPRPYVYDTRDLSVAEYEELVAWAGRDRRATALLAPAGGDGLRDAFYAAGGFAADLAADAVRRDSRVDRDPLESVSPAVAVVEAKG